MRARLGAAIALLASAAIAVACFGGEDTTIQSNGGTTASGGHGNAGGQGGSGNTGNAGGSGGGVTPPPDFFVTAYYPTWSRMTPMEMSYRGLTHIVHFAAAPTQDPAESYFHPADLEAGTQQADLIATAHANGVRVVMSVGGIWGTGADNMDFVAADAGRLTAFVTTSAAYAESKGYDGIEIDWEPPDTAEHFSSMLTQYRALLDDWTTDVPRGDLVIAAASTSTTGLPSPRRSISSTS